jgi:hypothetical protein
VNKVTAAIAAAIIAVSPVVATQAQAATTPKAFGNCTAMNKVFKGGIAKNSTAKNMKLSGGKKVKANSRYKPKVSAKWYSLNSNLDRDKDGIACER